MRIDTEKSRIVTERKQGEDMESLSEQLLLPYISQLGMNLSEGYLYRQCGSTFCCNSEIGNGFCWEFSGGKLFSISVYDFEILKNMSPKYNHPEFFTIGLLNEPTAKYILGISRTAEKIISYSMPEGTFSGDFSSGTHVKNASLAFSPEYLKTLTSKYKLDYKQFLEDCFGNNHGFTSADAEIILRQIFSAQPAPSHAEMYYEAKIMELFSVLLQWHEKNILYAGDGIRKEDREAIKDVITYLHKHYSESISIDNIEKVAYMGRNKLSHIFKLQQGMSITEYVRVIRMEKAKALLIDTTIPINAVAKAIGYQNQGSFTERFQFETGLTPTEYRNQYNK